jgi:hypothetical protein
MIKAIVGIATGIAVVVTGFIFFYSNKYKRNDKR